MVSLHEKLYDMHAWALCCELAGIFTHDQADMR